MTVSEDDIACGSAAAKDAGLVREPEAEGDANQGSPSAHFVAPRKERTARCRATARVADSLNQGDVPCTSGRAAEETNVSLITLAAETGSTKEIGMTPGTDVLV